MDVFPPFVFLILVKVAFSFCLWILLPWVQILITSFICIPQISSWIADCELIFCVRFLSIWSILYGSAHSSQRGGHSCCSLCFVLFSEYAELAWGDAEWGILVAGLLSCMLPSFPGCYLPLDIIFYVFVPGSVPT